MVFIKVEQLIYQAVTQESRVINNRKEEETDTVMIGAFVVYIASYK